MIKKLLKTLFILLMPLLCCSEVFALAKTALPDYHDDDY